MKYQQLEKNIKDAIIEQQLKLGYVKETVGLYYPANSIKNILECKKANLEELDKALEQFSDYVESRYGKIEVSRKKDRYCIKVPPTGSEYIHQNMGNVDFLKKLIEAVKSHDCTMEKISNLFHEFSDDIIEEKMKDEDFDHMICFVDKNIDEYYYCFKEEGCHLIYHRFLEADYKELIG
ncbi:MAG: DUF3877 family protein [Clostridiales bacterium]|nr:DUF3877 family protein [Clostridiales bacterium]